MEHLYLQFFKQHYRLLLLLCVLILCVAETSFGQATLPITYSGPWANSEGASLPAGWRVSGLSADGANVAPSTSGGSAKLKNTSSEVVIEFNPVASPIRLSFSLGAVSVANAYAATLRVQQSQSIGVYSAEEFLVTKTQANEGTIRYSYLLAPNTQSVRFTMSDQDQANLLLDAVSIAAAPEIFSFTPAEGGAGTEVTITGSGFNVASGEPVVSFGGVAGTITGTVTDTQVKAIVPAGATTGKVTITSDEGTGVSYTDFTVPKPIALYATPNTVSVGEEVVIQGKYLSGATAELVTFTSIDGSRISAAGLIAVSDNQVKVTVPDRASTGTIEVSTPAGASETSLAITVNAPTISSFTIKNALTDLPKDYALIGDKVLVQGTLFVNGATTVTFNGIEGGRIAAADLTFISETEVAVIVPDGAATGNLEVKTSAGTGKSTAEAQVLQKPVIHNPAVYAGRIGEVITIEGNYFTEDTQVAFEDAAGANPVSGLITYESRSKIKVTVPESAPDGGRIAITNPAGTTYASSFTLLTTPKILSFDPKGGPAGTTETVTYVTIAGLNFNGVTEVKFTGAEGPEDDVTVADFNSEAHATNTELTVAVPAGTKTGKIAVVYNGQEFLSEEDFTVTEKPVITESLTIEGRTKELITITGENFKELTAVYFYDANKVLVATVDTFQVNETSTAIAVAVPAEAITGFVAVANPAGESAAQAFTLLTTPKVISFNPTSGPVGTEVTITGLNFAGATKVVFTNADTNNDGVTDAQDEVWGNATILSSDTVKVIIPENALTGNFTIVTPHGDGQSPQAFTITKTPEIIGFASGNAAVMHGGFVGELVTITGKYFTGDSITVTFLGNEASEEDDITAEILSINETEIKTTVPVGAADGPLAVSNSAGRGMSSASFNVLAPEITSVSPFGGFIGDEITITGKYFEGVTSLRFGNTNINVTNLTFTPAGSTADGTELTSVTVAVPTGATDGITISTYTGTGAAVFDVLAPKPVFSPNYTMVGNTLTITGQYLTGKSGSAPSNVSFAGAYGRITLTPENSDFAYASNQITVSVPESAISGLVGVTSDQGAGYSMFYVVPEIENFFVVEENIKKGAYGNTVTITGKSLTGANVFFTGVNNSLIPAAVIEGSNTNTSMQVTVPAGAITGLITVAAPGNSSAHTTSTAAFEVTSPLITSFAQNSRRIGDVLTVYGYNLVDVGTVAFNNGVSTSQVSESSDGTALQVMVPRGATTGAVTVYTLVGGATSPEELVIVVPSITISANALNFTATDSIKSYTVSGENLETVNGVSSITIAAPRENFLLSLNGKDFSSNAISLTSTNGTGVINAQPVWIKYTPEVKDYHTSSVSHNSANASVRYLSVTGNSVTPFPVELISFEAQPQDGSVILRWATASEKDNAYFEVEASEEPSTGFKRVGKVVSKAGNSVVRADYHFKHTTNLTSTRYYRLKQVDTDGKFSYSRIIAVEAIALQRQQQVMVAPNPLDINSKVFVTVNQSIKAATLRVRTLSGKQVYSRNVMLHTGENILDLPDYNKLAPGIYIVTVEAADKQHHIKVVKQ